MEESLSNDEEIKMILKRKIHVPEIVNKIIQIKNEKIKEETFEYYNQRWNYIARLHYKIKDGHQGKFSFIFNSEEYIVKVDHNLKFYELTGISYQVIDLIHDLIHVYSTGNGLNIKCNDFKEDNYIYGILSEKIMDKIKEVSP